MFQSVDSFAVCNNCSRLSRNPNNCDQCGSALSEDNASVCYSVDPKRPRVDSTTPPPNGVNGEAESTRDSGTPTTTSAPTTTSPPPPTSATAETSATTDTVSSSQRPSSVGDKTPNGSVSSPSPPTPTPATSTDTVRPAGLFANINNIANRANSGAAVSSSVDTSANSIPANLTVNASQPAPPPPYPGLVPGVAATSSVSSSQHPASRNSTAPGPPPPLQQTTGPRVSLPSYNLQPAAPSPVTPSSANTYAGANKPSGPPGPGTQAGGPRIPEPPGLTPQAPGSGHSVTISRDNVLIPAQQIRIGSQKFKPLSPVTFKDDGILFTLKGNA